MGREIEPQKSQQQVSYTVEQLVAVNPYNPDILPDLENYVNEQVASQTYSLDANLCLLRLYQFEPERLSTQIVARILVKALMAMPAPDFSLCLFLIPERVQMEQPFKTLIVLSHYLETGGFRLFWDEAAKSRHIVDAVPGIDQPLFIGFFYFCLKLPWEHYGNRHILLCHSVMLEMIRTLVTFSLKGMTSVWSACL
ncbi:unnamed protein product [Linum tenue]|uniref:CSN8/PSMD8/EIF3K domain-containing protein n=1 Tax=Linum tenue TaxID=586396 RepID=A0AAV0MPW9_9ROSI|nr:unnamed protein product [Linum tenue]